MKPKLTPELAKEAINLVKGGASNQDVIAWLGVSETSFYKWIRDPQNDAQRQLAQGLKRAEMERKLWHLQRIHKMERKLWHLQRIHKAADEGDWKASAWYLERRYPNEYARTQRITGEVITTQRSDALTEAIKETARKMERGRSEP